MKPKRDQFCRKDDSCIHLLASFNNHLWPQGFIKTRIHGGHMIEMLEVTDAFRHEWVAIGGNRKLQVVEVSDVL